MNKNNIKKTILIVALLLIGAGVGYFFGYDNNTWGEQGKRLNIPLPEKANYGAMMAVGYYRIAQIQKQHKPCFKENIALYTKQVSKIFGNKINPIVE